MAYRFEDGEELAGGIARVAQEALDSAAGSLRTLSVEGVHDARTSLKRVRALLRLIRPALGEAAFAEQYARLRAVARALSPTRDAAVLVLILDELRERAPQALGDRVYEELRERFVAKQEATSLGEAVWRGALAQIAAARESFSTAALDGQGFRAIERGLRGIYGKGRSRFARARRRPDEARIHALRKRVKDLTYLVTLLEPLWPQVMLGMHETLKRLGDRLGEDRDLGLLRAALDAETFLLPAEREPLLAAIEARRESLRAKALPLGRRLFAERPRRFTARLAAYWEAWRTPLPE